MSGRGDRLLLLWAAVGQKAGSGDVEHGSSTQDPAQ